MAKRAKKVETDIVPNVVEDEKGYSMTFYGNNINMGMGSLNQVNDAATLIAKAYGYVAACAEKQAGFISSQTLRLYKRTNAKSSEKTRKISSEKMRYLKNSMMVGNKTASYAEQSGDCEEVIESPLLDLIHKPNDLFNGTDQAYLLAWQRAITGNSFQYIEKDSKGNYQLQVLYPQFITVVIKDGEFTGYSYGKSAADRSFIAKEDVFHQRYRPSRTNPILGEGPLTSCSSAADLLNTMNVRENMFYKNDCRPSFAIKVPETASAQAMIDTENKFNSMFRGNQNVGKVAVLKNSEIINLGFSQKDLEGQVLRNAMRNEVLANFGIPESEMSMDSTLASSRTGNLQFFRNINPLLCKNAEEMTATLVPLFYDADPGDYFFAYDNIFPEEAKDSIPLAQQVDLGIKTINEERAELGLAPIAGGDILRYHGVPINQPDQNGATQTVAESSAQSVAPKNVQEQVAEQKPIPDVMKIEPTKFIKIENKSLRGTLFSFTEGV